MIPKAKPKKAPSTNPVEDTFKANPPPPISSQTHTIGGILTTIYGLTELPPGTRTVSCLWLLHPRLETQECMEPFAAHLISSHNRRPRTSSSNNSSSKKASRGLIAVSFDARNHGSRLVNRVANEAWRGGNERHAQDMFSSYTGTAADVSLLLRYVATYIFPRGEVSITQNIVLGVSLGAHAAWQVLMHDPRVGAAVVCVGCPDYTRMMSDRARLSRRKTWRKEDGGKGFVGSEDFPAGLVEAVNRWDPAGLLLRGSGEEGMSGDLTKEQQERLVPLMRRTFGNKSILNLVGGKDKMVPHHCTKPFLDWMKKAIDKGGWFEDGLVLEDIMFDDCGHEVSEKMVREIERFVLELTDGEADVAVGQRARESKI